MSTADAISTLYELFTDDPTTGRPVTSLASLEAGGEGHVARVYEYEPRAGDMAIFSMSVTDAGMDPLNHQLRISIYAKPDLDAQLAQKWLADAKDTADDLLRDNAIFTAPTWTTTYIERLDALVAEGLTNCDRGNF